MPLKKEIRVIGIDDAPFEKHTKGKVLVVGTIFRGGSFMDGVISCFVEIDGSDSTDKLVNTINRTKFKPQLQAIMLDGIALGGFNVIDINKLSKKTKLPVIVVVRNKPDFKKIEDALLKLKHRKKLELIKKAGEVKKVNNVWVQFAGVEFEKVKELIKITSTHGHIPEPIRIAHLITSGVVSGESRGRA